MVFDSTQDHKSKKSSNVGSTAHAPWSGQADVLQRSLGNRATAALLQGASQRGAQKVLSRSGLCGPARLSTLGGAADSGPRWVARYEAGEHAQFGPAGKATVNGVEIDAANIVAMADFYRSPEAMQKADPAELRALNTLIDRDKQARLGVKGVTAPSNDEIEAATNGRPEGERFMDLNKSNFSHFAPPTDPAKAADSAAKGLDHKSVWEKHHRTALDQAHRNAAPKGAKQASDPSKPAQGTVPADATVTNLFAAHFLTDAFAAGHLINKQEIMDGSQAKWSKVATKWGVPGTNTFTDKVAPRLLADPAVSAALAGKQIRLAVWADVDAHRLSELLYGMSTGDDTKGDFFNLFARMVHDVLNRDGVDVTNKTKSWKLTGDAALNKDSLEQGRLAVAESERNLQVAASSPDPIDYSAMFTRVWAFVPKPTTAGEAFIKKVVDTVGDAGKQEAQDELVRLARDEIKTVISELNKKQRLRDKPKAAAVREARPEKAMP